MGKISLITIPHTSKDQIVFVPILCHMVASVLKLSEIQVLRSALKFPFFKGI